MKGRTADSTLRRVTRAMPVPRLELTVEREGNQLKLRCLELEGDLFRLGSHQSNDLVLNDAAVSRFHCQIVRGDTGWAITDTGSSNGTFVDGVRVRDADLAHGCRITLGDSSLRIRELQPQKVAELPEQPSFGEMYGESAAMRRVFALLEKVAPTDATVLIEGESGTGKELVATELVRRSPRASKPFIIIDCSAIAPNLIESELFGHVRGAFTGAERERAGAFEAASGGSVFLDEVGELPLEMQPKLLRVLEAREVRRMGENTPRPIDVRVIAATNRRLESEVNRGRFREDLYFRLGVVTVRLPPLRKRMEDLRPLVRVLLASMNAQSAEGLFTPDVLADMARHDWPGNVRELRNYVERTVILEDAAPTSERRSEFSMLPPLPERATEASAPKAVDTSVPFRVAKERVVSDFERSYLAQLLQQAGGNVSKAARLAKMDRMYLYRLLQRHGLRQSGVED